MRNRYEVLGDEIRIHLNRGLFTTIDKSDLSLVTIDGTWTCMPNGSGRPYVVYNKRGGGYLRIHREILSCPEDKVVDHINGDSLDNRRANLRIVSQRDNSHNRKYKVTTSTGVRGVTQTGPNSFRARVGQSHIGSFKTLELAEKAVKEARKRYLKLDGGEI